jgi:hypothetical protein
MQPKQMQQHQITQKQMTQHQMQVKQMANPQFTRQHNMHEHSMTIANPQRDTRSMAIPSGTFVEDGIFKFGSVPFRWLRTWIFSLLALIALPIGAMLILVGTGMQADSADWTAQTATVDRYDEGDSLRYQIVSEDGTRTRGTFNYDLTRFYTVTDEQFVLALSVCDLISRFTLPTEDDAEFTLWVNPADSAQASCIPVSSDTGAMLLLAGWVLVALSAIRLLRTINGAATRPAR